MHSNVLIENQKAAGIGVVNVLGPAYPDSLLVETDALRGHRKGGR
nr:hypothetical protein [Marinobacterium profundum]